jgi:hypothetical protein
MAINLSKISDEALNALSDQDFAALEQDRLEDLSEDALNLLDPQDGASTGAAPDVSLSKALGPAGAFLPDISGGEDEDLGAINAFIQGLGDTFTAGLSKEIVPRAAGLIETIPESFGSEESFGDLLSENIAAQEARRGKISEVAPGTEIAGNIAGLLSPGGVLSQGLKLGKAASGAAGLGEKAVAGSTGLSKLVKGLLGRGVEGGVAEGVFETINPETAIEDVPGAALTGAAFDVGTGAVGKTAGKVKEAVGGSKDLLKSVAKSIPGVGGVINFADEKALKKLSDEKLLRESDRIEKIQDLATKGGVSDEIDVVGGRATEAIGKAFKSKSKEFFEVRDPLIKQFKSEKVSGESIRTELRKKLDDFFDPTSGKFDIEGVKATELDDLKIAIRTSENLGKADLSVENLAKKVKKWGRLGKFDKQAVDLTEAEKVYRDLHFAGKDALDSALQGKLSDEGVEGAEQIVGQFQQARKAAGKNIKAQSVLNKLTKDPTKFVKRGLTAKEAIDSITANPRTKGPIRQVMLKNFLGKADSPKTLSTAIRNFGSALDQVFDPKTAEELRKLAQPAKGPLDKIASPGRIKRALNALIEADVPRAAGIAPAALIQDIQNQGAE